MRFVCKGGGLHTHLSCVEGHVGDDAVYVGRDDVTQLLGLAGGNEQHIPQDTLIAQDVDMIGREGMCPGNTCATIKPWVTSPVQNLPICLVYKIGRRRDALVWRFWQEYDLLQMRW